MTTTTSVRPLLDAMLNMTAFHREHEKFYSASPREQSVELQRHSRALHALADRWRTVDAGSGHCLSPYEGAVDLNADAALQLDGVLFMEGEGEPGEVTRMKRDIRNMADDADGAGAWLAAAMASNWQAAAVLLDLDGFGDLLGERHRIIANNWQAASLMTLIGTILHRAAELLDHLDLTPAALRADLDGPRETPGRVYSAAEMLDHAADLLSEFASLVHDNERRWRVVHDRIARLVAADVEV